MMSNKDILRHAALGVLIGLVVSGLLYLAMPVSESELEPPMPDYTPGPVGTEACDEGRIKHLEAARDEHYEFTSQHLAGGKGNIQDIQKYERIIGNIEAGLRDEYAQCAETD